MDSASGMDSPWEPGLWCSAAVAALFAVHPLHVESVAWVSERKDVLSTFFGLLAMAAYVYYAEKPSVLRYLPVYAVLVLGLMAKPMLVTLPFVFLLLDFWPLRRVLTRWWPDAGRIAADSKRSSRRGSPSGRALQAFAFTKRANHPQFSLVWLVLEKIPFLALSLASSITTYMVQRSAGAMAYADTLSPNARMMNVVTSYVVYLRKLIWPVDLALLYPLGSHAVWAVAASSLLLIAITFAVVYAATRGLRYLAVGWFWYLGMMVPVIGLVQVGAQGMADRYMYLPAIGLYIILVFGIAELAAALRMPAWSLGPVAAAVVLACLALTNRQVTFWNDTATLYERSIAVTGNNPFIRTQYAAFLSAHKSYAEALKQCDSAIQCDPNFAHAYVQKALAFDGLRQPDEALKAGQKALGLSEAADIFVGAHINMGRALVEKNQFNEAQKEFEAVLAQDPKNVEALFNLGCVHAIEGHTVQAIYNLENVLAINPDYTLAKLELKRMLDNVPDEALKHALNDLQKDPNDIQAADQVGRAFQRLNKLPEAIHFYYEILARRPQDIASRTDLGMALIRSGRIDDGIRELEDVLQADPTHDRALNTLAWLRAAYPIAQFRDGKKAVKYAELARDHSRDNSAGILDTLAAAYAEAGDFDKAIATGRSAVKRATETHDPSLAEFEAHLKLFEAHKPYHEPLPPGMVDPTLPKPDAVKPAQPPAKSTANPAPKKATIDSTSVPKTTAAKP
jgi:tetratricopeptide (TPR) repeat protein